VSRDVATPLGTTAGGKDIFAGIVHGMTISMQIGFITTTIVASIGITFGTVSAYAGGWADELMMRFVDIVLSFPTLLMFLLILYIYGAGLGMFILVFAAFAWGGTARYVRSKSLSISEEEFIKANGSAAQRREHLSRRETPRRSKRGQQHHHAAHAAHSGIPARRGAARVPRARRFHDPLVGPAHLGRPELSFAPWIVLVPGIVLFLTILAFNFLGDALLDALNPEAEAESA